MKHLDKITDYLKKEFDITEKTKYEISTINSDKLLVSSRIDLIAKLKYIEMKEKNYNYKFPVNLYRAHLEAFSNGTYEEPGNSAKNTAERYEKTFNTLLPDIKENGISPEISLVPVGENMAIMDGAHRTAISIYFKKEIPIIKFANKSVMYDPYFFRERLLDTNYLDYMVLEYSKTKKNIFCFCFWPRADISLKQEAIDLLNDNTNIIYDKEINLTYTGYKLFMQQIYHRHPWVGTHENKHKGVQTQLDNCYKQGNKLHLFITEGSNLNDMTKLKGKIRDIFGIGNYSVHSTDNQEESIEMLELLLNDNSIHMLNYGNPDKYANFNKNLIEFKKLISDSGKDLNDFVIDSSSVMSLYGLRDAEDIDFMTLDNKKMISSKNISNHYDYIKYYNTTVEDLILNPQNYLVYNGVKFITLDVLKKMKINRAEKKDKEDIKLINSINSSKLSENFTKFKYFTKRFIRISKIKTKKIIVKFLKRVGMYETAKKIIIRGRKNEGR